MTEIPRSADVVVIGGGLAGLTAAALLCRAGQHPVVVERAPTAGGRARTRALAGATFNLGPHALYRRGHAERILTDLGVSQSGATPPTAGALAIARGALHALPSGPVTLLSTDLVDLKAKLELGRFLAGLSTLDIAGLAGITVQEWVDSRFRTRGARETLTALVRLTSYANAPTLMSAAAALAQLREAVAHNVCYLDSGWQPLCESLAALIRSSGGRLLVDSGAASVELADARVAGVRLRSGEIIATAATIVAAGPEVAASVLNAGPGSALRRWMQGSLPVRAAVLDMAVSALPHPRRTFALGIDAPTYFSVHSASAALTPNGGATLNLARYLAPGEEGSSAERELEAVADLIQPGWREVLLGRQFMPNLTVANALPQALQRGLEGRARPDIAGIGGLRLCGDWVGSRGMLADAALASAEEAVDGILKGARAAAA